MLLNNNTYYGEKTIIYRWNERTRYRGSRALPLQTFQNVSWKVYDVLRQSFYSPYGYVSPFYVSVPMSTYTVSHVHLPVLISFLSLERQSSTSVSRAYVRIHLVCALPFTITVDSRHSNV